MFSLFCSYFFKSISELVIFYCMIFVAEDWSRKGKILGEFLIDHCYRSVVSNPVEGRETPKCLILAGPEISRGPTDRCHLEVCFLLPFEINMLLLAFCCYKIYWLAFDCIVDFVDFESIAPVR